MAPVNSINLQQSDWAVSKPVISQQQPVSSKVNLQNGVSTKAHQINKNQSQSVDYTKISKRPFHSKLMQQLSSIPPLIQGLLVGGVVGCMILTIVLPLWLTSTTTTGSTSATSTILGTMTSTTSQTTTTVTTTRTTTTSSTATTSTTAYYSCSNYTVTYNTDYPGHDIGSNQPMTFPGCCAWCLNMTTCTAFVLTNSSSICYIKTTYTNPGTVQTGTIACRQ